MISEKQIRRKVAELGQRIAADYRGRAPVLVGVLQGAVIFHADLIRQIELNLQIDFIAVSSYGSAMETAGEMRLIKDIDTIVRGTDLILVEDIVDTGLTINYLLRTFQARLPASLRVCSFLSKPKRRQVEVPIDYLGFEIENRFVVGYGLDYNELYRNLPHVAALDEVS